MTDSQQLKPLNKRECDLLTNVNFELDISKFILNPQSVLALENLKVSYILDKASTNAIEYLANPEKLVAAQIRTDISALMIEFLLDTHYANIALLKESQDESAI